MLIIVKFIAKIFSVLNGEVSPRQIAAGFAFGALIGLIPVKGLLPLFLLFLGFLININLPMMFVASAIFKLLSFGIDPLANTLGFTLLVKMQELNQFWTTLYNAPVVPYTLFNNTIVMGSFVIGVIGLIPMYFLTSWGVVQYRNRWREKFLKLKVVQIAKTSTLYKYYLAYKGIRGE